MQCTILIETCSQCTNSSIFYKNLPSKLAGMQVPQNGRRFGSYLGPQKFPKFLFLFYNIFKLIYNVSHSFLSLFNVKRLVTGKKVHFQPIVHFWLNSMYVRYVNQLFSADLYFLCIERWIGLRYSIGCQEISNFYLFGICIFKRHR